MKKSLKDVNPLLANEWSERNGDLKPSENGFEIKDEKLHLLFQQVLYIVK